MGQTEQPEACSASVDLLLLGGAQGLMDLPHPIYTELKRKRRDAQFLKSEFAANHLVFPMAQWVIVLRVRI